MTNVCPGACNATAQDDPVMGDPIWCRRDTARIHQRLGDLQTLAALHEHTTDGYGEQPPDQRPARNGHPPSPSPGFDLRDEIEQMLRAWEREYCRIRDWGTPPMRGRYASVSMEITVWLYRHFTGIMESPFAREFGDEVLAAARQLAIRAKATSMRKIGRVPCPRCDHVPLVSADDGHVYWCAVCGRPVPRDEYDELCYRATPDKPDPYTIVKHAAVPG